VFTFFSHPLLAEIEVGSSEFFAAQREMIERKPSIKRCYNLWYDKLIRDAETVADNQREAPAVELGSGSSYVRTRYPNIITSDIEKGDVDVVFDGRSLPFADESVKALLLIHVFHHIPDVEAFLREAVRVLVPGGVVSMVDETHTPFARLFFSKFHPERYDDKTSSWSFPVGHSMFDSNQALAWVVLFRDRDRFRTLFSDLDFEQFSYLPWFSYLLSGGVNLRSLIPSFLENFMADLDRWLQPLDRVFAIHWHLTLRKMTALHAD